MKHLTDLNLEHYTHLSLWLWGGFNVEKWNLVLTKSPYLFIAIENGLIPMKNLWLLSSIIRLLSSQMAFLCTSSCVITQNTSKWKESEHCCRFDFKMWSQSHQFIVAYTIAALPDLPRSQGHLIWVWHHLPRSTQQDREQSCSQQESSLQACGS